jgi:dipeptidyl aminopeptidase/acylaminoacyl peptidase
MKRLFSVGGILVLFAYTLCAQLTFSAEDLLNVRRVSDPQISPDGRRIAYTVEVVNKDLNRVVTQIYVMSEDGTTKRQITNSPSSSTNPRWSPDGRRIAFTTGSQIWTMEADGDRKDQVTRISSGAGGPVWSADGKWIAFASEVYPECRDDECNKAEDARVENSKVKAHVVERLLFKHWVEWRDRKRSHVFIVPSGGGAARDMTPGDFDSPPYAASSGVDYAFSPDGRYLAYLRNPDKIEAISTNSDIYLVPISGGPQKNITESNRGYDASPTFTRDGRYLLFRSQATPGFEADKWRIMRYEIATGRTADLTRGFDLQAEDLVVTHDGRQIFFTAADRGRSSIFAVPVEPDENSRGASSVRKVLGGRYASSLSVSPDGKTLIFTSSSNAVPAEIYRANSDGSGAVAITSENTASIAAFGLRNAEEVDWKGALNQKIHGFLLKPSIYDPTKRYPLIVLIHGGPQSAWGDNWGYRWNPQIFANQGYIVFMPNPRGSTGYGQKFVYEISGDWGGKAFTDISNGVAHIVNSYNVDKDRIGAAGASYGGYMVDWLLGHNTDPRFKYKTFVSHAGVYNLESMATATEELWFPNWDFKGMPWENPEMYARWSPHKFVKNFSTPTLVTAGELDYRVPVDQSLQLYTTLQLRNVESKLIIFPDEGHWILKPQNSAFWYKNVTDWFNKHLRL